jgi:O-glycosyl hydrolase
MKANADEQCSGNADTCTLAQTGGGTFDYDSYASYWRDSLDAYATAGIAPDYIGLQNNPDWLPAEPSEACVFLPTEGPKSVIVGGVSRVVQYPGLAEAQTATIAALDGLAKPPKILAPETSGLAMVSDYATELDLSGVDAFSHHLYGFDPQAPDLDALQAMAELAAASNLPVFQTEMGADGLGTALLIHYSTVVEGVAAYLQAAFYSTSTGPGANQQALLSVDDTTFAVRDPYYAMQHYALHTDPGWVRVDANTTDDAVLASAWRSPDDGALTVVLVNPGNTGVAVQLDLPSDAPNTSSITRTVFGGLEHAELLGSLSAEGILKVPPRAIVTVAFGE